MDDRVAIVTDSTAYLPPKIAAQYGIGIVAVQVVISGKSYSEGEDISSAQVAKALRAYEPVTTSRPSPGQFLKAYRAAAASGASSIVSAHLSSELSGTFHTAVLAATDSPIPVRVVDSRSIGMGLGFACISGAEVAANGGDPDVVAATILDRATASSLLFYVDTLDFLRRGGRIGTTAAVLGAALRVKPILHLKDGRVELLEKTRTAARALARLADLAVLAAGDQDVDLAVMHLDAQETADQLADSLSERLPRASILRTEVGAVVGTHVGPGMVAVTIAPKHWSAT